MQYFLILFAPMAERVSLHVYQGRAGPLHQSKGHLGHHPSALADRESKYVGFVRGWVVFLLSFVMWWPVEALWL